MKNIDLRVQKNIESISNLKQFLESIVKTPDVFSENSELKKMLKSQGSTAKYENLELNIVPSSINTVKRISDKHIDGGYELIDNLRKAALSAIDKHIERENGPNKKTKEGLKKEIKNNAIDILNLQQVNTHLLSAVLKSINSIKLIASTSDAELRKKMADDDIKKLLSILSLKPFAIDDINTNSMNVIDIFTYNGPQL